MKNLETAAFVLAWGWDRLLGVCFWWMHRLSSRQEAMLKELHEMTARIEQLSRSEHDLIREVHPKVSAIKEQVENVADAVAPGDSNAT